MTVTDCLVQLEQQNSGSCNNCMCGQGMKTWDLHRILCKNLLEIHNLEDEGRDGMVIFKNGFCRNGLCRWNVMKMAQDHVTQWQELLLLKGEKVKL